MTETLMELCTAPASETSFESGALFVAGATVAVGSLFAINHAWKEAFRRSSKDKGMER